MRKLKRLKKSSLMKRDLWAWDALAITIALILGFGPYALFSIFGGTPMKEISYHVKNSDLKSSDSGESELNIRMPSSVKTE